MANISKINSLLVRANDLAKEGAVDAAITRLRKLLKRAPRHVEALKLIGVLLMRQNCYREAADYLKLASSIDGADVTVLGHLSLALLATARFADAAHYLEMALGRASENMELTRAYAFALFRAGRISDAESVYQRILNTNPADPVSLTQFGMLLCEAGTMGSAADRDRTLKVITDKLEQTIRSTEASDVASDTVLTLARDILFQSEGIGAVHTFFERIGGVSVLEYRVKLAYAKMLERSNLLGQCAEVTDQLLQEDAGSLEAQYLWAVLSRRKGRLEQAETRIDALLAKDCTDTELRARILHEAGILADSAGRYEQAFAWFTESNQVHIAGSKIANGVKRQRLTQVTHLRKQFRNTKPSPPPTNAEEQSKQVFVVGFPRSGTTLIDRMLKAHRSVDVVEEKPLIAGIAENLGFYDGRIRDVFGWNGTRQHWNHIQTPLARTLEPQAISKSPDRSTGTQNSDGGATRLRSKPIYRRCCPSSTGLAMRREVPRPGPRGATDRLPGVVFEAHKVGLSLERSTDLNAE